MTTEERAKLDRLRSQLDPPAPYPPRVPAALCDSDAYEPTPWVVVLSWAWVCLLVLGVIGACLWAAGCMERAAP